jgi:hypothetical protein
LAAFLPWTKLSSSIMFFAAAWLPRPLVSDPHMEVKRRYSLAKVAGVEVVPVMGRADPERICTCRVEAKPHHANAEAKIDAMIQESKK